VSKLDVNIVERKWGQGVKAIGGEIRVSSLERALDLKKRGYRGCGMAARYRHEIRNDKNRFVPTVAWKMKVASEAKADYITQMSLL
jgi:hypothetical protein